MSRGRPGDPLLDAAGFVWAVGIEDTIIGQPLRDSGRVLDEYALTQHDRFWREDLDRAASLGVGAIRYGIPWHRVNPAPGRFDWGPIDDVLECAVRDKGLLVIADLVHYGTPLWLRDAFVDPGYPRAVAAYAGAFAERYADLVHYYTPLNEPLITASFCGQRGIWPPYLEGPWGWLRVVLGVVKGIRESVSAIRAAVPNAVVVQVEAAKVLRVPSPDEAADEQAVELARPFLPTDLLLGHVDEAHPLGRWMRDLGVARAELRSFRDDLPAIDVLGINYYPEFSVRELTRVDGTLVEIGLDGWDRGLVESLTEFYRRYGLPLFVSETSTEGDDRRRTAWLDDSVAAVERLRASGVPVRGYAWWPLFDFVDWAHASGGRPVEEIMARTVDIRGATVLTPIRPPAGPDDSAAAFLRRMGLWRLSPRPDGTLERIETGVAERLRALTSEDRAVPPTGRAFP
jgi:beta-glucosidase/6-phospho-beta-glucosidase/beta-galactosidase